MPFTQRETDGSKRSCQLPLLLMRSSSTGADGASFEFDLVGLYYTHYIKPINRGSIDLPRSVDVPCKNKGDLLSIY